MALAPVINLLLLASPSHCAVITAPKAPIHVGPLSASPSPAAASILHPLSPLAAVPFPLSAVAPAPAVPQALTAAPLLAAAIDPKVPVEASSAAGEKLAALLQGTPLARVKASEPVANVIHLTFPSQRLLASTMLRYQENYESPKYRNKKFTLAEFKDWYKRTKPHGRFTYYKDWDGFNIPSRILRRFERGDFDPLDPKEKALLVLLRGGKDRFYLIATSGRDVDKAVLRHEVAHGLWYTRRDYRRRAKALLKTIDLAPVYAMLERLGYHRSVWLDEAHAWLGDSAADLRSEGLDPRPYREIRRKLRELQKEYVSGVF